MQSKRTIQYITLFIVVLTGCYFAYYIKENVDRFPTIHWNATTYYALAAALFLYSATVLIVGLNWSILLEDHGEYISRLDAILVVGMTQFGKYLPGNLANHIGRLYMATQRGIPVLTTLQTAILETLILAGTSIVISIFGYAIYSNGESYPALSLTLILIFIIASLLLPRIIIPKINESKSKWIRKITKANELKIPKLSTIPKVASLYLFSFCISGFTLHIIAQTVLGAADNDFIFLTISYTSSWILGYIVPGAPAGLGIREGALMAALSTRYETELSLAISLTLRAVTTTGDGLIFLISYLSLKIKKL